MPESGQHKLLQYTVVSKNVLTAEQAELYELCQLAGVVLDPNVFKWVVLVLCPALVGEWRKIRSIPDYALSPHHRVILFRPTSVLMYDKVT